MSPRDRSKERSPHRVVMFTFAEAQLLDVAGPLEVFSRTARWLGETWGQSTPAYEIELVAHAEGPVRMSSGLELVAHRDFRFSGPADTLLVSGGIGYQAAAEDEELLAWLRGQVSSAQRIGSICTGALVLAAAGLLDGHEATTHWAYCSELASLAPTCRVIPDAIFVRSGQIFTSAGVTAGIDLALALVEQDWGRATAVAVAQELVVYRRRPGGQAQFSRYLEADRRTDRFGALQLWALENLEGDLSLPRLAERAGMSTRHFTRQFRASTGVSPAAYVMRLRVEEARRRLESGAHHIKDVARQCGFGDEQNLRRAFQRQLGVLPHEYRERFGG